MSEEFTKKDRIWLPFDSLDWRGIGLQWFAAEDEGKTEDPTAYKLQKAREEQGDIPKSQELTGALILLVPVIVFIASASWFFRNCIDSMRYFFERCTTAAITDSGIAHGFFYYFARPVLPMLIASGVAALASNIFQNRGIVFVPIKWQFSKLIPRFGQYFKKTLFSFSGVFNLLKSLFKVAIIFIVALTIIRSDLERLMSLLNVGLWTCITYLAGMAAKLLIVGGVLFLLVAIPDYLVQRREFMERMKMSKQEVKEEYKMMEGDPMVKNRLRQYMMQLMNQNMPANVAKSDVVITNPTHFAVAIHYDRETMPGPMVMAKGADALAFRIREVATANDVPIMENRPLARALYAEVGIGEIIPEKYYQVLVTILTKVYTIKGKLPA